MVAERMPARARETKHPQLTGGKEDSPGGAQHAEHQRRPPHPVHRLPQRGQDEHQAKMATSIPNALPRRHDLEAGWEHHPHTHHDDDEVKKR